MSTRRSPNGWEQWTSEVAIFVLGYLFAHYDLFNAAFSQMVTTMAIWLAVALLAQLIVSYLTRGQLWHAIHDATDT